MSVKYIRDMLFFYSEDCPLSNFYKRNFRVNGINFFCLEQAFMYSKAMVFGDTDIGEKIMLQTSAKECKRLGRLVSNFNEHTWNKRKTAIMRSLCKQKFSNDPGLRNYLLSTSNYVLVEASPVDCIWGVGMDMDDPKIGSPANWRGQNLLGMVLMQVREELRQEQGA